MLETERLRLRGWREDDLDRVRRVLCQRGAPPGSSAAPAIASDAWRRMAMYLGHWALRGYGTG